MPLIERREHSELTPQSRLEEVNLPLIIPALPSSMSEHTVENSEYYTRPCLYCYPYPLVIPGDTVTQDMSAPASQDSEVIEPLYHPSFHYQPHPHSSRSAWTVSLQEPSLSNGNASSLDSDTSSESRRGRVLDGAIPWAPFRTRADFEYTETAVKGLLHKDIVNTQLRGMSGSWSKNGSHITLRSNKDMEDALDRARTRVHQV